MMKSIVFYDGDCGLCQRSISLLASLDTKAVLGFAPLNGPTYKTFFKDTEANMQTVLFYHNGVVFERSDAVIEAIACLGGWKKSVVLLKIIPRFIRDAFYKFISNHRRKVSCIILLKDQRFFQ
jgi:predicted DCC family thiol-disulfide oxidoreductase YuxK